MEKEKSHFEDIEVERICTDPEHEPPMHLLIPAGKKYVHVCPTCGRRLEIYSQSPMF